ncbi:MAG: winged helix-turn-helix domain-containing protein [Candidatus Krumholzibacteriota bacterium]
MSDFREDQPGERLHEPEPPTRDYLSVPPFKVGTWRVEPSFLRLVDGDQVVQIGPRLMHLLIVLVEGRDDVVTRRKFMESVWSDAVVTTDTLSMAVSDLRRALGDNPQNPEYIETIRNVGYRMVAPVTRLDRTRDDAAEMPPAEDAGRAVRWNTGPRILVVVALLILAPIVGKFALSERGASSPAAVQPILQTRPLTSYPSSEIQAALSPSGNEVAFAWSGPEESDLDIYVKRLDTDPPQRRSDLPGLDYFPAWSPAGDRIVFAHARTGENPGTDIMTVPAFGGPALVLFTTDQRLTGLDWSPDGAHLVLSLRPRGERQSRIHFLDLQTLSLAAVQISAPDLAGCDYPAYSPDGTVLAFVGSDEARLKDIYTVPVTGGQAKRLTFAQREIFGLDWACDSRHIIFASLPYQNYELWKVDSADRTMTWLPTPGDKVMYPSINCATRLLAYEETSCDFDVWRIDLNDGGSGSAGMVPIIDSTREDYQAQYSRDGQGIVFVSTREGSPQIWVSDPEGNDPAQLTHLEDVLPQHPRWSPDGRRIGFNGIDQGISSVYFMNSSGGLPERLSSSNEHEVFAGWSPDSQWLYYVRVSGTGRGLWRMRTDGSRQQILIPDARAVVGQPSEELGLVYLKFTESGLWRREYPDKEPELLVDGTAMTRWRGLAIIESGVYFTRVSGNQYTLNFFDFQTRQEKFLRKLDVKSCYGLSVAPDRQSLIFNGYDFLLCDLVMVPGFH